MLTVMFPSLFGLERGLVVHLDLGIHVADVVVAVQVHVTKFLSNSTNGSCLPRGVTCFTILITISLKLVSECF